MGTRDQYLMHYSNPSVTGGQKHTHTHTPALFWLVAGCKTIDRWPSKATVYYNFVFFVVLIAAQIDAIASPPVLHTGPASSS
jgi:hypothetical protein